MIFVVIKLFIVSDFFLYVINVMDKFNNRLMMYGINICLFMFFSVYYL